MCLVNKKKFFISNVRSKIKIKTQLKNKKKNLQKRKEKKRYNNEKIKHALDKPTNARRLGQFSGKALDSSAKKSGSCMGGVKELFFRPHFNFSLKYFDTD